MQQKIGVPTLEFFQGISNGRVRVAWLINARYGEWQNEEAFKILAEKEETIPLHQQSQPQDMWAAEIGNFMSLLTEGSSGR